jgi:NADPH2:quinone reductase
MMKAITVERIGGPEVMVVSDVRDPVCQSGEIVVRNHFVGINYGDLIRRSRGWSGMQQGDVFIPGFEGVGEVIQVGSAVETFRVGERVAYLNTQGAYAEKVAVPALQAFSLPASIDSASAAASVCTGTTAWHLLELARVGTGEKVLVHGAAGGVGAALLQLASRRGVVAFASVSSEKKSDYAMRCGAFKIIRNKQEDFAERILAETDGKGVQAIFDCVGQAVVLGNTRCIAHNGRWLYYGSTSGHASFPGLDILSKELCLHGFVIFNTFRHPDLWRVGVNAIVEALSTGVLTPEVEVYPFDQIQEVHRRMESREVTGKLVVRF